MPAFDASSSTSLFERIKSIVEVSCWAVCVCLCVCQLKQLEMQLEEEYDDKQKVVRERRELESKLLNAQDQV